MGDRKSLVPFQIVPATPGQTLRDELDSRLAELKGLSRSQQIAGLVQILDDMHAGPEGEPNPEDAEFFRSPEGKKHRDGVNRNWQRICGDFLTRLCHSTSPLPRSVVEKAFNEWSRNNPGPSALTREYGPWVDPKNAKWERHRYVDVPEFLRA